ncbi:hypothetical protein RE476_00340 [Methanolobus mangrovi]|uniref:Uncharacterized protein n=1 Tax=Methanolobus mangrovi TaxID=3072977 RepID=A0AA51UFH6_9EURY|nr:hypothetical protein [Methanolobus mangrovi]WMW22302.1 hypothetical protein RE476_00340 [Methanolobus mangrovi]
MKDTWEKVFEYASVPLHGTMSRKLREGVNIQINEGKTYAKAVVFLGEQFVRITEDENGQKINTYFDWTKIESVRTYSKGE